MAAPTVIREDVERGLERIGAGRRVLEERIQRAVRVERREPDEVGEARLDDRVRVVGADAAGGVAEFTEVGRHFPRDFGPVEPQLVVTRVRGDAPELLHELLEGEDAVEDRGRVGVEAVVTAGAGRQHRELGGVEEEDLEPQQPRDVWRGNDVVDGGVEREPVRRLDVCDSHLRVDRAFVGRELCDRALRSGVRIADESRREMDDGVFRVLAVARALAVLQDAVFHREVNRDVRMAPGLPRRRQRRVGGDRSVGPGERRQRHRSGHRDKDCEQASAGRATRPHRAPPPDRCARW